MAIREETRLSVDLFTRDVSALAELQAAIGNQPKDYRILRVDTSQDLSEIKPYSYRRGGYVGTITVTMRPSRDAQSVGEIIAGQVDNFYGISQDGPTLAPVNSVAEYEEPSEGADLVHQAFGEAEAEKFRTMTRTLDQIAEIGKYAGTLEEPNERAIVRQYAGAYATAIYQHMKATAPVQTVVAADQALHAVIEEVVRKEDSEASPKVPTMQATTDSYPPVLKYAPDQAASGPRPIHPSEANVYLDDRRPPAFECGTDVAPVPGHRHADMTTPLLPEVTEAERTAKRRQFQIDTIRDMLRKQDDASRASGGVRPFPDRMSFARQLSESADAIKTSIPRPGGGDVVSYRTWLKGIAANCVRELERTSEQGASAL